MMKFHPQLIDSTRLGFKLNQEENIIRMTKNALFSVHALLRDVNKVSDVNVTCWRFVYNLPLPGHLLEPLFWVD